MDRVGGTGRGTKESMNHGARTDRTQVSNKKELKWNALHWKGTGRAIGSTRPNSLSKLFALLMCRRKGVQIIHFFQKAQHERDADWMCMNVAARTNIIHYCGKITQPIASTLNEWRRFNKMCLPDRDKVTTPNTQAKLWPCSQFCSQFLLFFWRCLQVSATKLWSGVWSATPADPGSSVGTPLGQMANCTVDSWFCEGPGWWTRYSWPTRHLLFCCSTTTVENFRTGAPFQSK